MNKTCKDCGKPYRAKELCNNCYLKKWRAERPSCYKNKIAKQCKQYQKNNLEEIKAQRRQYYIKNKEYIKQKSAEYAKNYPDRVNKRNQKWKKLNPEKARQYQVNYRGFHRDNINSRYKEFLKNPKNKLSNTISNSMRHSLKSDKKGHHWEGLVGYNLNNLMQHLESLFQESMTWDNQGKWHIDHIKPISSFSFESYEDDEFKQCWALENLQPLWAQDNLRKNKYIISNKENPNYAGRLAKGE